jgi:uncharacterized protein (DUF433 family)
MADFRLIGRGLYTLAEASRLTRVPERRIRRWTRGYWYRSGGRRQWSDPVIPLDEDLLSGAPALDFADLNEIRFLNAFREHRVSWHAIRIASERAKQILQTPHPFSSRRFQTDGRTILAQIQDEAGDRHLLDLVRNQWEFEHVVFEFLLKGLHYDDQDAPQRWAPLGDDHLVLLDPARSFGAPIVSPGNVRTRILYGAFKAEQSFEAVADWYAVEPKAVADAVTFEQGLRDQRRAA